MPYVDDLLPAVATDPGIAVNFPEFIVLHLEDGDALITCKQPRGCGNGFVVHYPTWLKMESSIPTRGGDARKKRFETRACPYCFKASRIPKMEITNLGTGDTL